MTEPGGPFALKKEPGQGRFFVQPRGYWYPVALSSELVRRPKRVVVFNTPYVIYRTGLGEVACHLDRCPHRNVPLSQGRCLQNDTIQCPYHGWRFRPDGSCDEIPGLTKPPRPNHRVETFSTRERYGVVWMCPHPEGSRHDLLSIPQFEMPGYSALVRHVHFPANLHAVVENALDVPHTSILHRGLFRGGVRNRVTVTTRRYQTHAEAEYAGEPPPSGLVARLLSMGKRAELTVRHWDRFVCPNVLQVEYQLGDVFHLLVTGFCTPVTPDRTELFAVVMVRTPYAGWLQRALLWLIEPLAMRVYRQDVEILRRQERALKAFGGERFMSTELDVLGHAITRLLKEAATREEDGQKDGSPGEDVPTPRPLLRGDPEEKPREVTQTELEA